MSRVHFRSPSGEADLRGSERAHAAVLLADLSIGLLGLARYEDREHLQPLVSPDHYAYSALAFGNGPGWAQTFALGFRGDNGFLTWRGRPISSFTASLNTAMALGGDPLRFFARLHGQCELYCWVDGPNRGWLAGIIERGQGIGLCRPGQNWEGVVALLRARDDEPVVLSESVGDSFPNAESSDWLPPWPEGVPEDWAALTPEQETEREERSESWYELPSEEQWDLGMKWLRAQPGKLELRPDDWEDYRFGSGVTVLDLVAGDRDERLGRLLGDSVSGGR